MTREDYLIIWGLTFAVAAALVLTYLAMFAIAAVTGSWA